jgi:hypothetical protein
VSALLGKRKRDFKISKEINHDLGEPAKYLHRDGLETPNMARVVELADPVITPKGVPKLWCRQRVEVNLSPEDQRELDRELSRTSTVRSDLSMLAKGLKKLRLPSLREHLAGLISTWRNTVKSALQRFL